MTVFIVTENEDSDPSEESSKSKSSQEERNSQGQKRIGRQTIQDSIKGDSIKKKVYCEDLTDICVLLLCEKPYCILLTRCWLSMISSTLCSNTIW